MLDPDISTTSALHHLHRPDDPTHGLDRRRFLQLVGMGMGAGLVAGPGSTLLDMGLPGTDPSAWATGPVGSDDGILVVIGMYGGNDGLNTVVQVNDSDYYEQHGTVALAPETTLPLDANSGLNPALTEFKRFWDAGQLAIVEGVGHMTEDFSHFNSMAKWMAGQPSAAETTGWVGRWLDEQLTSKDLYTAAEIGPSLPLHLIGRNHVGTTVPVGQPEFGTPRPGREDFDNEIFAAVTRMGQQQGPFWQQEIGRAQIDQLEIAQTIGPKIPSSLPDTEIVAKLEIAARLINANLGFRVLNAGWTDFDSHALQPDMHGKRMSELNAGLQRFFQTLHPDWAGRVTIMTFSEFGRTSWNNDGAGTDHGSSAPQFVLGGAVKGGFYGQRPSLTGLRRWERPPQHVDLRDYYGSILDGWMGGGASTVLPGFKEDLGIFTTGPSTNPTFPGTTPSRFTGLVPERIYDSRKGLGGRTTAIGPGETVKIKVAGMGQIPATGALALAMNITAIRPSETTYLTGFPTGSARPTTATLNPRVGQVVPNMSVLGIGIDGTISVYNNAGTVHVTVDALGYYSAGSGGAALTPLTPSRVLDTRFGVGAPAQKVQGGKTLTLKVAGVGGVPTSDVDSVVLNLTSAKTDTGGWITAWPSGTSKPEVANLTYRARAVVPNLVVCKLGTNGSIDLEASAGSLDLIGDVVGCSTTSGALFAATTPARLLDTRKGIGAGQVRVGPGEEIVLQVAGRGGAPSTATAAVLNITAIKPSTQTYLTVYPDGESRPTAASLNPDAGKVSGNLVVAKIGESGKIRIFNESGDLNMTADLTGYHL